jgi:hypothetical protein
MTLHGCQRLRPPLLVRPETEFVNHPPPKAAAFDPKGEKARVYQTKPSPKRDGLRCNEDSKAASLRALPQLRTLKSKAADVLRISTKRVFEGEKSPPASQHCRGKMDTSQDL